MSALRNVLTLLLVLSMSCKESKKTKSDAPVQENSEQTSSEVPFYVGTYTDGDSEGIYKFFLAGDGSLRAAGLMAETENPSFLALSPDGQYLLAVNEVSDDAQTGYLSSFKIGGDTLSLIDRKPTGGAHPCHVVADQAGYVVVANYSGGNMGLLKVFEDGGLSDLLDVQQHTGRGSHPRQDAPHAHSGWFTQKGEIISVDLGTNQLWFSEIERAEDKFVPGEPSTFSMEAGAGPRHLVIHPKSPWIYVINELSSSVSFMITDASGIPQEIRQTISTLPDGFTDENTCADIRISSDGKFLYASNRGHNSIAIYEINPESGMLKFLGHEATLGETPRNFNISPDDKFLLVANQTTSTIVAFRRDTVSGLLFYTDQIDAPSPVCILFD
ncbi:lactonase family protein [Robiginitalea aurantiaca]|uniref:Lactonase family protein n=1 Tax=Robiginitalea aurantiaca TaxID=3056915 RepID=A0ABT7WII4_9FLAO|nr:lactonase family protein [Robiginitalea aurantiaca]MDM9632728.1 lactonase family protein [Robiginitalea aurantiaca]